MWVAVLSFLFIIGIPGAVFAVNESTPAAIDKNVIIDEQINSDQIKEFSNQIEKYSSNNVKEIIPEYDPQKILSDIAKGNFEFSISGIFNRILKFLFNEIFINISILIRLIILVILCAVLKNLQASFLSEGVGELAFYACYVIVISIMLVSFGVALNLGREVIDNMVAFMQASVPVLITLLVSGGNITSAGVFQPVLIMMVEVSATIIKNVFIPLIFLSIILSVIDNISGKIHISKLANFFKQICSWGLGLMLTIFIGIITVQGSVGAVVDGVTSKTTKFAIGAMIPVAGKYLADAADAVIGCTLLIKNAAGIAVMIGVIGICVVPLLKILALIVLYRLTSLLIEPISEERITNSISEMANSLTYLFGIVASVTFMFLISITAIIGASNISAMMR